MYAAAPDTNALTSLLPGDEVYDKPDDDALHVAPEYTASERELPPNAEKDIVNDVAPTDVAIGDGGNVRTDTHDPKTLSTPMRA